MIEPDVREDSEAGADGSAFGIVGAVDEAEDAGLDDGSRAHAAGFDGDVEGCAGKAIVAEQARRFAENDDFGVGRGIVVSDGTVAGTSECFAVVDKHGADGNFAGGGGGVGFSERLLHEFEVRFHLGRENNTRKRRMRINIQSGSGQAPYADGRVFQENIQTLSRAVCESKNRAGKRRNHGEAVA